MADESMDHVLRSSEEAEVVVIMVPFPAHSHLNQLLQLSCLVSSYNITVYYACPATHVRQAKVRFNNINHLDNAKIHFHEFPSPPNIQSPPPDPNASVEFPTHVQFSSKFYLHLREPMAALLREVSSHTVRRIVVIHDILMSFVVQDTATVPNAESYLFNPSSAFFSFFDEWQMIGKPFPLEEPEGLPSFEGCHNSAVLHFITYQKKFMNSRAGTILNSCRSVEGTFIDLWTEKNGPLWAIGPINVREDCEIIKSNSQHRCLKWLDNQAPKSVLYVSFGTLTTLKDEQIKELAMGLEQSEQKFIWVFRDADEGDSFATDLMRSAGLPECFEERVKEFGLLVRDWSPQLEILAHPSTGSFLSHCGWNSCLESITMGVPIAAWPMHSDQPKNAFLVTDILKVGVAVRTWVHREELVITSSTISETVKRLMSSNEGKEMRKRAEELGTAMRLSVKEGGASRMELDSFIAHITR